MISFESRVVGGNLIVFLALSTTLFMLNFMAKGLTTEAVCFAIGTPHLHGEFNFTGSMSETAGQSLHHSCNLCDKEFRYLRTVRVTAAVYRGFHSKLITLLFPTFQHRAVATPGMCRFPNQKIGEHPFSRSYGVILPSSFDMVLSSALVYSTCSPVSVTDATAAKSADGVQRYRVILSVLRAFGNRQRKHR
ncbi:hypothetical protein E3N88_04321 [Mikania micrantha]|uniref:Uncharacterized protein n=1 Tax=Mikania micrantha TaxID=192012 RepID=A0A5N6PV43_9ASTR|nr:hypothetical protein E3N88_04321 [Mikania micrantha]